MRGEFTMAKSNLPKLVIFGDETKKNVAVAIAEFTDFAKSKAQAVSGYSIKECPAEILKECDFAVVFGGDGSIIAVARCLSRNKTAVIGVNVGKLGFLAEFSVSELKDAFDSIMSGKVHIEKRIN